MREESSSPPPTAASVTADVARVEATFPPRQSGTSSSVAFERTVASLLAGGFLEHYEIIRKLGEGGMGVVLLARDTRLGRLVAIKLLQNRGRSTTRLLAEARATALCRHENIVVIHDVDEADGGPYMVLEYLEGRTLRDVLSSEDRGPRRALPRGLAIDIVTSVLRALAAAHARGVVHRDLKPENIMILDAGGIKVLDFGLARCGDGLDPSDGGTLAYMAPEQWRGEPIDARTDLWAVGVLLHELLAGEHPLSPLTRERLEQVADLDAPMPRLRDAFPELSALSAIVERCSNKRREARFASADELLTELTPLRGRATSLAEGELPFAGLSAFQEADADRFFGRERDIAALTRRLRRQRLITVVGPSGAGKSSFLRAGVIPALKHSGEDWDVLVLRPGRAPLLALGEALAGVEARAEGGEDGPPVSDELRVEPGLLGARLRAHCRARGPGSHALVFVDQFEELYTQGTAPSERSAFLQCLLGVADDASSPLRVVVAIRSDFLDRMAEDPRFLGEVTQGFFLLPPMGPEALREALLRPVEAAGHHFEDEAMLTGILDELSLARTPLPLLQFSAVELWEARDPESKCLKRASYERLGGVVGSLSTHADTVFSTLSLPDQRLCRAVFTRLVTPERTRAIVSLSELASLDDDPDAVETLVQHLCTARLVLLEVGGHPGAVLVELVHEALIERWPRLARWLDESAADAQLVARLRAATSQWQVGGEAPGLLWRDRAAEEARAWYERRRVDPEVERGLLLGRSEERYLLAMIELQDQARRRRRRAIVGAFAVLGAVSILVLLLALSAQNEARRADAEAARVKERNIELSLQALRGRNATRILAARKHKDDPTLVLALAREVEPDAIPKEWAEIVSEALSSGVTRHEIAGVHGDSAIYAAAISPDGTRILTASHDKTARILAAGDHQHLATLRGHDAYLWFAAWSPDGTRILTASGDSTARIWNADGTGEPLVLRGHEEHVNSALMSPDGQRVVTASGDRTARVYRAADGEQIALLAHGAPVTVARFSPDGLHIVTTSLDGIVRVWDADGKRAPRLLRGHIGEIVGAAWSPDGAHLATAGKDTTVRVWDAFAGTERLTLRGHEDKVMNVVWSRDGKRIASVSKDKTARIWDTEGAVPPVVLRGHKHWVYTADFTPDGRNLLTASLDTTIRLWGLDEIVTPIVLAGHTDNINDIAWSPDGARIATAASDGTARVWRADGGGSPVVLRGPTRHTSAATWSPDGARIVTISSVGKAQVWSLDDLSSPISIGHDDQSLWRVDWSPSGDRIVTASTDGWVRVWASDGAGLQAETRVPTEPDAMVGAWFEPAGDRVVVADGVGTLYLWNVGQAGERTVLTRDAEFESRYWTGAHWSPDGARILASFGGSTARIWDVRDAAPPITLRGHEAKVTFASWSPDGRRILTTSKDRTARLWAADGAAQPVVLHGHGDVVSWASMSPDGERIATASEDTTTRIFRADGSGQPFVLGGSAFAIRHVAWSPDGKTIAQHAEEPFARLWPAVEPFRGPDDVRLWRATSYCIPVPIRRELLQVTEDEAQRDQDACVRRVLEARAAEGSAGGVSARERAARP
ncbi:protein kinase domain-containing protein [Chondromyces crocatus]|uniref:Protein kinase domain-containing protein n=1 Tax=Chondromyces crocatus TaxID=52 RepID=A0A0K1ELP8_CHOCO|nr:protein kinase [Chondromyces crocatus]AKT41582.1 uncharacterized protein CMC5_057890 [Chondromyces crocatus]